MIRIPPCRALTSGSQFSELPHGVRKVGFGVWGAFNAGRLNSSRLSVGFQVLKDAAKCGRGIKKQTLKKQNS